MGQHKTQTAGCAACNYMHHRCLPNCIFAPYFPATSPSFGYISQVYSFNNIKKILQSVPVEQRRRKAESLAFEAEARIRNPQLGCVGYIHLLQQHFSQIERDIQEITEAQFSAASYQPPLEQQYWHDMPQLTTMTAQSYHEQPDDFPIPKMTQTMSEFSAAGYQPPLMEQQYQHEMPQLTTMTAQSYHEQPDFPPQSYHEQLDDFPIPRMTQTISGFSAAGYQPPMEQQYQHEMPQLTTMTVQSYHEQPDDFPIPQMTQTMSEMCPLQPHDQLAEMEEFLCDIRSDDLMTGAAVQGYEADLKDLLRVIPSTQEQDDGMTNAEIEEFTADLEDLLGVIPSTQDDGMTDAEIEEFAADLEEDLLGVIPSTQGDGMTDAEIEEFAADLEEDLLSS